MYTPGAARRGRYLLRLISIFLTKGRAMEALLRKLNTIPEAAEIAARVEDGDCQKAMNLFN